MGVTSVTKMSRIPAVINHIGGERERELSERRRDGFLAALSRNQGKTL